MEVDSYGLEHHKAPEHVFAFFEPVIPQTHVLKYRISYYNYDPNFYYLEFWVRSPRYLHLDLESYKWYHDVGSSVIYKNGDATFRTEKSMIALTVGEHIIEDYPDLARRMVKQAIDQIFTGVGSLYITGHLDNAQPTQLFPIESQRRLPKKTKFLKLHYEDLDKSEKRILKRIIRKFKRKKRRHTRVSPNARDLTFCTDRGFKATNSTKLPEEYDYGDYV